MRRLTHEQLQRIGRLLVVPVILIGSVFVSSLPAKAANFTMQTGYYVGNGTTQTISGLGFQPDFVMVKSENHPGSGAVAVFKTSAMPADTTMYFNATGTNTNSIIEFISDGFTVSTAGLAVNVDNTRYTYVAFAGSDCTVSGTFCVGGYTGNGGNGRTISTGFAPGFVMIKRDSSAQASFKTAEMAANQGEYFTNRTGVTNGRLFGSLGADNFAIGNRNNANNAPFYFVAFKKDVSMQTGSYTGNSTDDRDVTAFSPGITPSWVITKNTGSTAAARYPVMSQKHSYGDSSNYIAVNGLTQNNQIQKLQDGGFQVGSGANANESGATIYWMAWAGSPDLPSGSGTFSMATGSYIGDGVTDRAITGLSFRPDLVIVNGGSEYSLFRTSLMAPNTACLVSFSSACRSNAILDFTNDGFTLGTNSEANGSGIEYHWQAWGNAYSPTTRSGAADFEVGAYVGNLTDDRLIPTAMSNNNLVMAKSSNGSSGSAAGVWRTTANNSDESNFFANGSYGTNIIQDQTSTGFQLGTNAAVNTITNYNVVFWFAFKEGSRFTVGTYQGSGSAQDIATGFQPDLVWVKSRTGSNYAASRSASMPSGESQRFHNLGSITGSITDLIPTGFSVGTDSTANTSSTWYYYAAWQAQPPGELTVDIVDSGGASVSAPSLAMSPITATFACATSTGILGSNNQRLRVTNTTANPNWTVDIAATSGTGALWSASGGKTYDFNDPGGSPAGCSDGMDSDNRAGQLTFSPLGSTITPSGGCSGTGVLKGSSASFNEGILDSLTLLSGVAADTGCYWDVTDISISQMIPVGTESGSYSLNLTMTVIAN